MSEDIETRFDKAMRELREAFEYVKKYSADFDDDMVDSLLEALQEAGPNHRGQDEA